MFKEFSYRYIIPPVGFVLIYLISVSIRLTFVNKEKELKILGNSMKPIYSFWHGRLFLFPFLYKSSPDYNILVSPSIDGNIIADILRLFGYSIVRGSSYKQGKSAFLRLVKLVKDDNAVVIIGDGSRGPRYKMQKGIIRLAKLTGAPILPMVFSTDKKKVFNSWDHFIVPYPFSRGVVVYGDPLYVDMKASNGKLEEYRSTLESRMEEIRNNADNYFEKNER